jgi:hypothetical protein
VSFTTCRFRTVFINKHQNNKAEAHLNIMQDKNFELVCEYEVLYIKDIAS